MKEYKYIRKFFTYNGKRYSVRGKTEKEAMRKMIEKQAELKKGEPLRNGDILFKKWAEIVRDKYKPNVSDDYKKEMEYRLNANVLPVIGSEPVNRITPLQLQEIMSAQKGKSKSHITKLAQELSFIFEVAVDNHMIADNPAKKLQKPRGTNNKRRALTATEREHLLKVIPTDPRFVFFELMLYCGCRPGEAAEVRFEDVTQVDGIPFLHIRGTKTANSDRLVPIPKELRPRLANSCGYVATTLTGSKHNESSYKRMVASLERAMNISMGAKVYRNELLTHPLAEDFVPYFLRHTYCTDLKKKGVDIRIAKNLMGHADIRTTANIYDHDDGESLILAAKQLGLA